MLFIKSPILTCLFIYKNQQTTILNAILTIFPKKRPVAPRSILRKAIVATKYMIVVPTEK